MKINIGWLYPDLMNTYGDRGNIIALSHRAKMMGIKSAVNKISINEPGDLILKMDILFMGGAQDKQQEIVNQDLKNKGLFLKKAINDGVPGLYVCGAYQFLGKYYKEADGKIIDGIGVFDLYTACYNISRESMAKLFSEETRIFLNNRRFFYYGLCYYK